MRNEVLAFACFEGGSASAGAGVSVIGSPAQWCAAQSNLALTDLAATPLPQIASLSEQDRLLICGNPRGWRTAALALQAAALGAEVLLVDECAGPEAAELIKDWAPTVSDWQPWQLRRFEQGPGLEVLAGPHHRRLWLGGARAPDALICQAQHVFGERVMLHYSGFQWPGWAQCGVADWVSRPGTAGQLQVGLAPDVGSSSVSLLATEPNGEIAPAGQIGELMFHVEAGYQPTGDLGYLDEEGFVFPLGASANALVLTMGRYCGVEGERVLERHEWVAEGALLALDEVTGAQLGVGAGFFAAVELIPSAGGSTPLLEVELLTLCQHHLSAAKRPLGIAFVEQLPRRPSGEVDLAALAARLVADQPQVS